VLLSNQQYWAATYQYSDELDYHIQSIKVFITNLILNDVQTFHIEGIDQYLDEAERDSYGKGENLNEIIETCMSRLTSTLMGKLKGEIEAKLEIIVNENKVCIYKFNNKLFYSKKRANEEIIRKLDRSLTKEAIVDLNNSIITFWQHHTNNLVINILNIFMANKTNIRSLISDANDVSKVDFLPVNISNLPSDQLEYANNEYQLKETEAARLNEEFGLSLEAGLVTISGVVFNEEEIGLIVGEVLFLYDAYTLFKDGHLTPSLKLDYLKKSILFDDNKKSVESEKTEKFRRNIQDEELLGVLSLLEQNIYVSEEHFEKITGREGVETFFDTGYLVESECSKHNQFFIPFLDNAESLFGLHNNSNARDHSGQHEKGLKTWIDSNGSEKNTVTDKKKTKVQKVMHLYPELAFYFKEKFFEDLLGGMLEEIREDNPALEIEIISNKVFYFNTNERIKSPLSLDAQKSNLQEFDYIVSYKNENSERSTLVLEAKTKLSKFVIQDQAEKVEKYIKYDDLNFFDKYCLVGFNTEEDVYRAMAYFINKMKIDGTGGLGFKYPLPTAEQPLYCTASNNRDELKSNLLALFK